MPTDSRLEEALRAAVRAHSKKPGPVPPTVNTIRTKAEEELGLEDGFYKSPEWEKRSKDIIQDQFHKSDAQKGEEKATEEEGSRRSLKRPSPSPEREQGSRPRKKSKVEQIRSEDEDESTALSEPPESEDEAPKKKAGKAGSLQKKPSKVSKPPLKKAQAKPKKKKGSSESELSDAPSEAAEESEEEGKSTTKPAQKDNDDSSELSSVIDEPAPKKKRAKNNDPKPSKTTKSSTSNEPDSNAEEIKRLQGWLVKCGIRKVWGKELKPFETPKAKIAHLRGMLSDAGMTGRYSNEKAAQIKEARELAADIEAVQEGNEKWGKNEDDEGDGGDDGRPKRRLVRGAANYDFLSSDGEETD